MILQYTFLRSHPAIFKAMTGLYLHEFDELLQDVQLRLAASQHQRRNRPDRKRAIGAGHPFDLEDRDRKTVDKHYSGKKKQSTLKSQITVDEESGAICDVAESVVGPQSDIKTLSESGVIERLPEGVGAGGNLAYVGIAQLHPQGLGITPRGKDRRPEDIAFNRAFARRRIVVEHTIGRIRTYESLAQMDRNHRQDHSMRVRAVAGLVNRQLRRYAPC